MKTVHLCRMHSELYTCTVYFWRSFKLIICIYIYVLFNYIFINSLLTVAPRWPNLKLKFYHDGRITDTHTLELFRLDDCGNHSTDAEEWSKSAWFLVISSARMLPTAEWGIAIKHIRNIFCEVWTMWVKLSLKHYHSGQKYSTLPQLTSRHTSIPRGCSVRHFFQS
jgi:hypothetical protein